MAALPALAPFIRWAAFYAGGTLISHYGLDFFERTSSKSTPGALRGRKVVLSFDRSVLGAGGDAATTSFSLVNITSDEVDTSWTDADYAAVAARIDTWWAAIKGYHKFVTLQSISFYEEGPGVTAPNPALKVYVRSVAATGAGAMPAPQTAHTITLRTAVRRSWGRMYMPTPDGAQIVNGRFNSATFATYLGAFRTMVNGLNSDGFVLSVYSPTHSAYLGVAAIEIDDSLDVIRSRKLDSSAKLIYTTAT